MEIYFSILTVGSILYFLLIARYTGKWNSTFAGFWLLNGIVHLLMRVFWKMCPEILQMGMKICLLVGWILFFIVTIKIFSAMKADLSVRAAYVIVLGAQVRGTRITGSLMRRLDSACHYLKLHPETKVIVSGGQGKGEDISEAEAMAEELKRRGIARERIIEEDRSTSTEENLRFSAEFIGDMTEPVMLVTNNFHICRALMLGKKVGYTCLYGIAATSNPVLFLNYMVREFFAVLLTKVRSML